MALVTVIAQLFENPFLPLGSEQTVVFLINLREENVHASVCKCVSVCVVEYVCSVSAITLSTLSESCFGRER